jgi:hypothetical protein
MTTYLLDTNACIALINGNEANVRSKPDYSTHLATTLSGDGERRSQVECFDVRDDGTEASALMRWIAQYAVHPRITVDGS